MNELEDKVILVTGAGKGTGRAVAEALAAQGARIAANDVTPVNLDETVQHITAAGGQVKAYVEDIAKKIPIQALINSVLDDFGHIDILVNCAEVEPQKTLLEMDDWDWQRTLDVNLSGAFLLTQSTARVMKEKGGGIILLAGERAKGPTKRAAYFASKAALETLAQKAAEELRTYGIDIRYLKPDPGGIVDSIKRMIAQKGA